MADGNQAYSGVGDGRPAHFGAKEAIHDKLVKLGIDHTLISRKDDGGHRVDLTVPSAHIEAARQWHAQNHSYGCVRIFLREVP
jgi:hypothetical protein